MEDLLVIIPIHQSGCNRYPYPPEPKFTIQTYEGYIISEYDGISKIQVVILVKNKRATTLIKPFFKHFPTNN